MFDKFTRIVLFTRENKSLVEMTREPRTEPSKHFILIRPFIDSTINHVRNVLQTLRCDYYIIKLNFRYMYETLGFCFPVAGTRPDQY